jgi:hypothetical protein
MPSKPSGGPSHLAFFPPYSNLAYPLRSEFTRASIVCCFCEAKRRGEAPISLT